MGVFIGVDVATADIRAVAVDASGEVLATTTRPLPPPERTRKGWSEQPGDYGRSALDLLADLTARLRQAPQALAVVSTSGTIVPCDKSLNQSGRALLYDDRRAGEVDSGVNASVAAEAPALARVAWLKRHRPASRYLHVSDVILAKLAGEQTATDTSTALKTGADPETGTWNEQLLNLAGVSPDELPRLDRPTRVVGTVSRTASDATGLPEGMPLVLGMTDGCAGQVAAGAIVQGQRATVLGTTLVLKVVADRRIVDSALGIYSHWAPGGFWWSGGASNVGAGFLRGRDRHVIERLDHAAATFGRSEAMYYPSATGGERFPFTALNAGGSLGRAARSSAERHRARLEGVAYVERLGYEVLDAHGARGIGPIRTAGGATNSRFWLSLRASVLGVPLEVPAHPDSGFGAAVMAAVGGSGETLDRVVPVMVRVVDRVDPDPSIQSELAGGYERFVEALASRGWLSSADQR